MPLTEKIKKIIDCAIVFLVSLSLTYIYPNIIGKFAKPTHALEIILDATILDGTDNFGPSPTIVFTSSQIGYIFYVDATSQDLAYIKTINGGTTWAAATVIDTTIAGWTNLAIWYDQWTPGDTTGTKVHIAASDDDTADIYYTYLDTSDDTLKGSMVTAVSGTTTLTEAGDGPPSITKNGEGNFFISGNFTSTAGGKISKCTDGTGDVWSDITPAGWSSVARDQIQLLPLITDYDIIAIKAETGTNTIKSQIYDESLNQWPETWTSISSLTDNTTYDQWFSASINKNTGTIHLVLANNTTNSENDIEYWYITDSIRTWTQGTNIYTNASSVMMPVPFIDNNTGDLYVSYLRGTLGSTVNVYYQKLGDGENTWSGELQIISSDVTGDDYKGLRGNMNSNFRLFTVYYDDDDDDMLGSTILSEGIPVQSYIDTAIIDATDEYNPSPSTVFIDEDEGYHFFIKTDIALDGTDEYAPSPAVVFTNSTTGYAFFVDATSQNLIYKKTIGDGSTWSGANIIDSSTTGWTSVAVWYDQWTPGDTTGTKIHIAASDDTSDDIYYTYLDTSDDSLRTDGVITAVSGTTTITETTDGPPSIAKDGSGEIFICANFSNTAGGKISKSTNSGDSWNDITPSGWSSVATDQIQILPLLTDNDLIAIRADTANNDIDYQTYEDNIWGGTWTTISSLVENTTDDQWFSASLKKSTGNIYLSLNNNTGSSTNDMEFWTYSNSSRTWTQGTNLFTDNATILSPVPLVNESTGTIYVAYIRGTLNSSTRVYYKSSSDGGSTWSSESSTISPTLADDLRYLRGNLLSGDNLYVLWHNDDTNAIKGNSLISPLTFDNPITGQSVVYRKTLNGGLYWDLPISVATANGGTSVAVWYDQWTPGDTTGSKIHITFSDDQTDDYYYTSFDTTYDTVIAPKQVLLGATITELAVGVPSITKGASGNLFLSGQFNTTAGGLISKSTDNGSTWTDCTPSGWSSTAIEQIQILPLLTGNDIIAIKAETGTNTIKYQIYDETTNDTWAGEWNGISSLTENTTYDQWFSASLKKSTGDIYLALNNNTANSENDIEFWSFDDSSRIGGFTQKTNVYNDSAEILSPVPLINESNGDIFVAYIRGTLNSLTNVYYKKSTDGGSTWGTESMSLSSGLTSNLYYLRGNLLSSDRLYVAFYNNTLDDIMGNQIDISVSPIISITISDGAIEYGIMEVNTSRSTISTDLDDMQTITNNGNVNVDLTIKGGDTTSDCSWTLASSTDEDQYVNQFCNDTALNCSSPPTNFTELTTNYQSLAEDLASSGTIELQLRLTTPTESTCYDEQSLNVTILASQ